MPASTSFLLILCPYDLMLLRLPKIWLSAGSLAHDERQVRSVFTYSGHRPTSKQSHSEKSAACRARNHCSADFQVFFYDSELFRRATNPSRIRPVSMKA